MLDDLRQGISTAPAPLPCDVRLPIGQRRILWPQSAESVANLRESDGVQTESARGHFACKVPILAPTARSLHTRETGTHCSRRSACSTQPPAAPRSAPPVAGGQAGAPRRRPPHASRASRLLRNPLRALRESARRGIPEEEMFPTCSPRRHVAGERVSRISRPRAKFVEGERRDSNPRPPGPQPGRSRSEPRRFGP